MCVINWCLTIGHYLLSITTFAGRNALVLTFLKVNKNKNPCSQQFSIFTEILITTNLPILLMTNFAYKGVFWLESCNSVPY